MRLWTLQRLPGPINEARMVSTKQPQDAKGMDFIQFEEKVAETNMALAMLKSRTILWPSGEVSN